MASSQMANEVSTCGDRIPVVNYAKCVPPWPAYDASTACADARCNEVTVRKISRHRGQPELTCLILQCIDLYERVVHAVARQVEAELSGVPDRSSNRQQ